jgi:DNA mismatch endonuclease, patch repair protein
MDYPYADADVSAGGGRPAARADTGSWATTPAVRRSMQHNRPRDTSTEVALRSALHRAGLRFYKHRRPLSGLRCEPDVLFPGVRLAVFVDGCFWHSCPDHGSLPKANGAWWQAKLENTQIRDRRNDESLRAAGWTVVRLWEHCSIEEMTAEICQVVSTLRQGRGLAAALPKPARGRGE